MRTVRIFDNIHDAEEYKITFENFGGRDVRLFGKWHGGKHEWQFKVVGIIDQK